jgi:hypothetical protein
MAHSLSPGAFAAESILDPLFKTATPLRFISEERHQEVFVRPRTAAAQQPRESLGEFDNGSNTSLNHGFEESTERLAMSFSVLFTKKATPCLGGPVTSAVADKLPQPHWRPDDKVRQPDSRYAIFKPLRMILIQRATPLSENLPNSTTFRPVGPRSPFAPILSLRMSALTR